MGEAGDKLVFLHDVGAWGRGDFGAENRLFHRLVKM